MIKATIAAGLLLASMFAPAAEPANLTDWESLSRPEIPEWFMDAKFGIYTHLGVYCVPAHVSEWYPHFMYTEGHAVQTHHEATYDPLSDFDHHDFIPLFTLENFDAEEWAEHYARAGAKFAGPVAEHAHSEQGWGGSVVNMPAS